MSAAPRALDRTKIADLDHAIRHRWASVASPRPIFIMGLHRSGTTFLYASLARGLHVARLTLQDVVFFPRRVHSQIEDGGAGDRRRLEAYFADCRDTHGGEDMRLSPDAAEEYGWVLRRQAGSFRLSHKTLPAFENLSRKLMFLHPGSRAVLFKNPWDTGFADRIAQLLPEARFVFIRRDPIEILSSELRNAQHFGARRDPLLRLLMNGIPELKALMGIYRLAYHGVGKRAYSRVFLRMLYADIRSNLRRYEAALRQIPPGRAIEIGYGELVDNTTATLDRVARFLGLPLTDEAEGIRGRRRPGGLLPAVAAREQELRTGLEQEGLERFLQA